MGLNRDVRGASWMEVMTRAIYITDEFGLFMNEGTVLSVVLPNSSSLATETA